MKKFIAAFFIIGAIAIFAIATSGIAKGKPSEESDFLRIHVRANSNSTADQDVKYLVKQHVVDELTPIFASITTKAEAMDTLAENLAHIEKIGNFVLAENGFDYGCNAAIKSEHFPTRSYTLNQDSSVTLPEGVYDALILELGSGGGDNWWCVVYPPLCFLENNIGGDTGVKYKSKLQDLINKWL